MISESLQRFLIVIAGIMLAQTAGFAVAADGPKTQPSACVCCGATCGLREICVCECSTKKKPKTEYTVTCDPICVPRCGSWPWPWSLARCLHIGGCADCQPAPCRASVRYPKKLIPKTTDEDVAVIERKVESICGSCAGCGKPSCCSSDPPGGG